MDQPLGKVTVALYEDGYVSVSIDRKVTGAANLRRVADTLARLADTAEGAEKPVDCPVCGGTVRTISARPNGTYEIGPCGHSF